MKYTSKESLISHKEVNSNSSKVTEETRRVEKEYGGRPKFSYSSLVGRRASN